MNKMNKLLIISLTSLFLMGCGPVSSVIDSPNYDGGLQGDSDKDTIVVEEDTRVTKLFRKIMNKTYFSYETNVAIQGTNEHFIQYYTPYAWYNKADNYDLSFGYGMTKENHYMFKYYLSEDGTKAYPSVYEYSGYGTLEKIQELYSPLTLAHPAFLQDTIDTLSYTKITQNRYLLTDTETMSVFQYMTTYGSSISNYIVAVYVDIIDETQSIFDVTCDLGTYGKITSRYTPMDNTPINFVNDMIANDGFKGVDQYDDVSELFNLLKSNNYTLHGPKSLGATGGVSNYSFDITCTNDYFLVDYKDESYNDFGYAFIKSGNTIPVRLKDENGNYTDEYKEYTLDYDACFRYEIGKDGELYFSLFKGPIENEGTDYRKVDTLPEQGEEGVLYIVEEDGKSIVYEWIEKNGVFQYSKYSDWYDTVGDFYIGNGYATFYLGSTALLDIGPMLFEKKNYEQEDGQYISTNSDVESALANGLFGWGFQSTTTWMNYIQNANLTINRDGNGNIVSSDIGLEVKVFISGVQSIQNVFYTIDNINNSSNKTVEDFLNKYGGNLNEK